MKKLSIALFSGAIFAGMLLSGCGQSEPDKDMTPAQVKEAAAKMDTAQIQSKIDQYVKVIDSKKTELEKATGKLKEIPIDKILSEDAGKIKNEIEKITGSISSLNSKMQVYAEQLKAKAGK